MSFAEGYVEVAERLTQFFAKYPDGSIQTELGEVKQLGDKTFIAVQAAAFRNPDDPRPARAQSWELWPGKTSFTKDSEAENAETSAVGRALAFLGFETKKSVASANEVRAKRAPKPATVEQHPPAAPAALGGGVGTASPPAQPATNSPRMKMLFALMNGKGIGEDARHGWASQALGRPVSSFSDLSPEDLSILIDAAR